MRQQWIGFGKFVFSRTLTVYLLCGLGIAMFLDYPKLLGNAVPQTMSRLTPPIDYFNEFVDRHEHFDRFKLMNCVYYHQAVANFQFKKQKHWGWLGFATNA